MEKLGLRRDIDLALHLPLRYEDETRLAAIGALRDGDTAQVEGTVRHCEVPLRGRRQLLARIADEAGDELVLRFLHFYPSHQKALAQKPACPHVQPDVPLAHRRIPGNQMFCLP